MAGRMPGTSPDHLCRHLAQWPCSWCSRTLPSLHVPRVPAQAFEAYVKERLAALSGKAGDLDDVRAIMDTLKEVCPRVPVQVLLLTCDFHGRNWKDAQKGTSLCLGKHTLTCCVIMACSLQCLHAVILHRCMP